jgi:phosphoribosylanthranilate isomerase
VTHPLRAPRIKFCGITRLEDAQLAVEAGAWAVGLILWPGSRRAVELPEAELIARTLRRQVEVAGVFVNAPLDEIARTVDTVGLTMVQLHGDEGPTFAAEVARRTGAKVVKAARVQDQGDITALTPYLTDFHLLDAHVPGQLGGTGTTFDHDLVARRRSRVPLILSGGLTPANVGAAVEKVRPFAVDVASGIESAPGIKDPELLTAFAEAVAATAPAPEAGDGTEAVAS